MQAVIDVVLPVFAIILAGFMASDAVTGSASRALALPVDRRRLAATIEPPFSGIYSRKGRDDALLSEIQGEQV